jgi:hypothetical protein
MIVWSQYTWGGLRQVVLRLGVHSGGGTPGPFFLEIPGTVEVDLGDLELFLAGVTWFSASMCRGAIVARSPRESIGIRI